MSEWGMEESELTLAMNGTWHYAQHLPQLFRQIFESVELLFRRLIVQPMKARRQYMD
jgi:hypothetical protein